MKRISEILNNGTEHPSAPQPKKETINPASVQEITDAVFARANAYLNIICPGRELSVDDNVKKIIHQLILYFAHSEEFEKQSSSYSLRKGILLRGGPGVGKTFLLTIFCNVRSFEKLSKPAASFNELFQYGWQDGIYFPKAANLGSFISSSQIEREFSLNGYPGIQKYFSERSFAFDDLASENLTSNYFGTKINVMETLLTERHRLFETKGIITHATTNYTSREDFERAYGVRVLDRMRQVFNVIDFAGQSKRV